MPMRLQVVSCGVFLCLSLLPGIAAAQEKVPGERANVAEAKLGRRTLRIRSVEREYFLYHPGASRGGQALPLVIAFHGSGQIGSDMARITGMNQAAAERGVMIAYATGINKRWGDGRSQAPVIVEQGENDIEFVRAIIHSLVQEEDADPARVYVVGMCNGGFMAMRVGCQLGDRIAAIGAAASTMPTSLTKPAACNAPRPMPMLLTLGTADAYIPFDGGQNVGSGRFSGPALSVKETLRFWADFNECSGEPAKTRLPVIVKDGTELIKVSYSACRGDSEVVFYSVTGGGHTWPGGEQYAPEAMIGKTTGNLNASETILDFFLRFRR